jgi:outer membrane immunogenic protein
MKTLLSAATLVLASAPLVLGPLTAAHADPAPGSDVNWTGPYVGLTLGYGGAGGKHKIDTNDPNGSLVDPSGESQSVLYPNQLPGRRKGIEGGGEIGFNVQHGPFVMGAEADFSGLDSRGGGASYGAFSDASKAPYPDYTSYNRASTSVDWLSTGRGRLGYAVGRNLIYVDGGVAFGQVDSNASFAINNTGNPPPDYLSGYRNVVKAGYTVGGGLEHAVTPHISVKAEYLYYDLGSVNYQTHPDAFTANDIPGVSQTVHYGLQGNIARVGMDYRF